MSEDQVRQGPDDLSQRTDDELMVLSREGRREAFHVLVRRHQTRAVSFGARYLGSSSLARDAAQEAFVELYLSIGRYEPRGRFLPYWNRILLNRCRMFTRADALRRAATDRLLTAPPGPTPTAEDLLVSVQLHQQVERALEGLSEKLRVVLALRFGADLPLNEIAETLSLPVGTVKSRLFNGLSELRAQMERTES